jgi:DNA gyrase/topoisomerase IV subunit B
MRPYEEGYRAYMEDRKNNFKQVTPNPYLNTNKEDDKLQWAMGYNDAVKEDQKGYIK